MLKQRDQKGVSLATIVVLGVIAMMWLAGTSAIIMPIGGRVTKERAQDVARNSAEASLDWAVSQLSMGGNGALNPPQAGQSLTVPVPSSVLSDPSFSGTISVFRPATGAPSYSYLYDSGIDPNMSPNITGGNGWQVVTAQVSNAGGNVTRTVRVILKPEYKTNTITVPDFVTIAGPPVPIFSEAMYAPGTIALKGNANTNSYNSTHDRTAKTMLNGGDVGSGSQVVGSGGVLTVDGNLTVYSNTTTTATTVEGSGNVSKTITSDGGISSKINAQTEVANTATPPPELPPVPTAPANASSIGTISLSGKQTITLGNGYYINASGTRVTVPNNGNYAVNSISMAGQSQIIVDNTNGPVNVFVQGSGSSAGIGITGQGITNMSGIPGQFRIWYGGTGNVQISGQGTVDSVIYAPNAPVSVTGGGTLQGAVVGNTVSTSGGGNFLYDEALKTDQTLWWNPPIQVEEDQQVQVQAIKNYQAVSWREL